MASLFDILDALQAICISATTPNGPTTVFGHYVDVGQGWPIADGVDKAMAAGRVLVSVYPVPGTTSDPGQIMNWDVEEVSPPVHGISAVVTPTGFTLTGYPCVGEYATVVVNGNKAYSYTAVQGDLCQTVCASLLASMIADFPSVARIDNVVSVPGAHDIVVRIGAIGQVGQQLHRQRQQIRIVVWSPAPVLRATVANTLDLALKRSLKIAMPDTSTALLVYQSLNLSDEHENQGTYRADLIYTAQWDTFDILDAYEVTSSSPSLAIN